MAEEVIRAKGTASSFSITPRNSSLSALFQQRDPRLPPMIPVFSSLLQQPQARAARLEGVYRMVFFAMVPACFLMNDERETISFSVSKILGHKTRVPLHCSHENDLEIPSILEAMQEKESFVTIPICSARKWTQ